MDNDFIEKIHIEMTDRVKNVCPLCENRLQFEDLGDDDTNKPVMFCSICGYQKRLY